MDKASLWLKVANSIVVWTVDLTRSAQYGHDQRIEVAMGEHEMIQTQNMNKTDIMQSTEDGTTADALQHSLPKNFTNR